MFRAMAQPVEDLGEPPETVQGAGRSEARPGAKGKLKSSGVERRVPCDRVISEVDVHKERATDMSVVARNLNTSAAWVERCMLAYGRHATRPSSKNAESKAMLMESWEQDEPEELGPEENEEAGAPYRRELPEKQLRKLIPPTPGWKGNSFD
jgi:hypothetical protein